MEALRKRSTSLTCSVFSSRCVGMGLLWPTAVTPGSCLNNKFWPQLRSWQINRPALTAKLHQLQMRHHTNKDLALFGDFIHSMSPWVSVRAEVRSIPGRTENHYRPVPKASQSKHQLSWIPFMKFHEFSWPNPCIHIFSGDGLTHSSPPGLGPPAIRCTVWHTRFGEGKSFADGKKLYTRCPHPPTAAKMAARQGPRGAARRVEGTADHRKPGSRKAFNSFGRRRTPREARAPRAHWGVGVHKVIQKLHNRRSSPVN